VLLGRGEPLNCLAGRIDELPGLADDLLATILMLDVGADKLNA
jgi:hypothetical protein